LLATFKLSVFWFPKRGIDNLFFIKASSSFEMPFASLPMTTPPLEATSFYISPHKRAKTGKSVLDKKDSNQHNSH
jgi:hypothetical protein